MNGAVHIVRHQAAKTMCQSNEKRENHVRITNHQLLPRQRIRILLKPNRMTQMKIEQRTRLPALQEKSSDDDRISSTSTHTFLPLSMVDPKGQIIYSNSILFGSFLVEKIHKLSQKNGVRKILHESVPFMV